MKAIALYSGGLDSTLAVALMMRLGIEVQPITYTSPFGDRKGYGCWEKKADNLKVQFGLDLKLIPFEEELIGLVKEPAFGLGQNLNPCIDCRLTMLKKTKSLLKELDADFVVTGEVMGQRPMSQNKVALELIDRKCGLDRLLLRPLSAKHLTPTVPEVKGWVDREKLLALQGRSRKAQLGLAGEWKLTYFDSPAGGCLLTDYGFSRKTKVLLDSDMLTANNVRWIQSGRFFNMSKKCKMVVARNKEECERLEVLAGEQDIILRPDNIAGPTALLRGERKEAYVQLAADVICYYTKGYEECSVERVYRGKKEKNKITGRNMEEEQLRRLIVG